MAKRVNDLPPAKRIHPTILPLPERHKFPLPLSAKRAGAAEGKELRESNEHNLRQCLSHGCRYLLIDDNYAASIERFLSEDIL